MRTGQQLAGIYVIDNASYTFEQLQNAFPYRLHSENIFYVFESVNELLQYMQTIAGGWNKEAYASQLNDAHNALFRKYYTERDYLNVGEIPLWLDDVDYGQEASALRSWWISTCKQLADYLAIVTEETAIPVEEYIQSLPRPAL